ncbi:hypothetical protein FIU87_05475 [Bacillus sp. THAF10]|uniref:hypothetical protein n=1 Tax=Bacillus sp. THAF10 TaxID=2587848 RepID=UPI0012A91CD3|nr:hypothetical protein [Bacillus sp. THAF10]QFT88082.1 hypothetical protein FIU87_05475 [Bacillus sp. THAF10]
MSTYKSFNLDDGSRKRLALGEITKVCIDLYLENPKRFNTEFLVEEIIKEYSKQKLDLEA